MKHALVSYAMDMQRGLRKNIDALATEELRTARAELLTNFELAAEFRRAVVAIADETLESRGQRPAEGEVA